GRIKVRLTPAVRQGAREATGAPAWSTDGRGAGVTAWLPQTGARFAQRTLLTLVRVSAFRTILLGRLGGTADELLCPMNMLGNACTSCGAQRGEGGYPRCSCCSRWGYW